MNKNERGPDGENVNKTNVKEREDDDTNKSAVALPRRSAKSSNPKLLAQ